MLAKAARRIAYFFAEKNIIQPEDKNVYAYGYEILLSEAVNWIITIIIAILARKVLETALYMLAFMQLREAIGGFHAKSHIGCITLSTAVYALCLFLVFITPLNIYWWMAVIGISAHMVSVLALAPVAHPNKPFTSKDEYLKFRKKSYILSVIYCLICIILMTSSWNPPKIYGYYILLGILSASISMVVEYVRQKIIGYGGENNEEH